TQVAETKESDRAVDARDKLLDHLLEAVDFPLPSGVIETEVHQHLESESRLEDDEHREEVTEETTKALRRQLVLDALSEQVTVNLEQNELLEFLVRTAQQYGQEPSEFIQQVSENGQINLFIAELQRNKALAVALRQVEVVDSGGEAVDLSSYIGTDEEDAAQAARSSPDCNANRPPAWRRRKARAAAPVAEAGARGANTATAKGTAARAERPRLPPPVRPSRRPNRCSSTTARRKRTPPQQTRTPPRLRRKPSRPSPAPTAPMSKHRTDAAPHRGR